MKKQAWKMLSAVLGIGLAGCTPALMATKARQSCPAPVTDNIEMHGTPTIVITGLPFPDDVFCTDGVYLLKTEHGRVPLRKDGKPIRCDYY